MNPEPIALCIVAYQRGDVTERCIDSVRRSAAHPYHIFLVDNASTERTACDLIDRLTQDPDIDVFRSTRNLGPSHGRNVALTSIPARFPYVALLDNDIVALPGWDLAAIAALKAGADLIQPKLLEADGRTLERGPNRPNQSPFAANPAFIGRRLPADAPEVNGDEEACIVGGTSIIKRSVFDKIGLFDERLHIGEDFDFSFRARAAGFSLRYAPNCTLIHDHGFDLAYDQVRGETIKYLSSHVIIWRRWRKAVLSPAYLAWYAWLHRHDEPMYLPQHPRWRIMHRRLLRRAAMHWIMSRYPNAWVCEEDAELATESLARRLGMTGPE